MMKTCIKCNIEKEEIKFEKKGKLRGYGNICKECRNISRKKKEFLEIIVKEYKCSCCSIIKDISYFNKCKRNPQGINHICKECQSNKNKKRYEEKSDIIKKQTLQYFYDNKEKVYTYRRKRAKERRKEDHLYTLKRRLRNRLYYALKRSEWKKDTHFAEYIGCTLEQLESHIESKFKDGMTWENKSDWAIDHIVPLAAAQTEEQLYKLCHYTNLQPLWSVDNAKKDDTLIYEVKQIDKKDTHYYLLNIHYAKRIPTISYSYGLFANGELVGVITYGPTASPITANALVGPIYKGSVYELNRLCLKNNLKNEASLLVGRSLKLLPKGLIVLSFADSDQDHLGIVYQATNFKYYGKTDSKREVALKSNPNAHSLSIYDESKGKEDRIGFLKEKYGNDLYWRNRPQKHRYIFITGKDKSLFTLINYAEHPYPKKIS